MQDQKYIKKRVAVDCWKLFDDIPRTKEYEAWDRQLILCTNSVGAN